jgi:hypothetical protein
MASGFPYGTSCVYRTISGDLWNSHATRSFQRSADSNRRDTLTFQKGNEPNDADDDQINGHNII